MHRSIVWKITTFFVLNSAILFGTLVDDEVKRRECVAKRKKTETFEQAKRDGFWIRSTQVIDLSDQKKPDLTTSKFCIYNYTCSLPERGITAFHGTWTCELEEDSCEDIESCIVNEKSLERFGMADARNAKNRLYNSPNGTKCREHKRPKILYSTYLNSQQPGWKAFCYKDLTCTDRLGVRHVDHEVICPTVLPKTVESNAGAETVYDTCPSPEECFDTRRSFPTLDRYLADKAAAEKKKVSETLPRNSKTTTSGSGINGERHSKSK